MKTPTYSANEIKAMCQKADMDYDSFKILADLIDEEIDLYPDEDIPVLMTASMIIFTRSMLKLSFKIL
jgi:hypothetical protein